MRNDVSRCLDPDIHLGSRHAQVGKLLEFLRDLECERLYIVGDFIDGWQLRR